jgi:predicted glycoside hydrolase/deacetylase ChbG (UPF0249 family)
VVTIVNPALEKLGFKPDDRLVIVHADDVGMCHAANAAFWEDQAFGVVTCGSAMVPCSWVPEMAAWCREHPQADVGVHLTLTSEWEGYRWGPVSTRDPQSGLVDRDGCMWRSNREVYDHMDVDAAIAEMRAQVEMALSLGIDVTHIDTHMGTVMHPQLVSAYVQLALECRVPAMLPRISEERAAEWGVDPALGRMLLSKMGALVASGFPVLDHICAARDPGDGDGAHRLDVYRRLFDSVPVGITHLLLHPSVPGHDIEAITDGAAYRIADYETFLCPELKDHVTGRGIHLIGYRRLRDLIRSQA